MAIATPYEKSKISWTYHGHGNNKTILIGFSKPTTVRCELSRGTPKSVSSEINNYYNRWLIMSSEIKRKELVVIGREYDLTHEYQRRVENFYEHILECT